MLRVGLTGGLGSGKSTAAEFFRQQGAHVIEADAVARSLMEPGQSVYAGIVAHFGPSVTRSDGTLDRKRLATLAFDEGRLEELDRIVHPPVIAAQEAWMEALNAREPDGVAIVESALVFEASGGVRQDAGRVDGRNGTVPGWRERFDRIVLVTAPEELKIARFVQRMSAGAPWDKAEGERLATDARRRLRAQIPDEEKVAWCDYVIRNDASVEAARERVVEIYTELKALAHASAPVKGRERGAEQCRAGERS